MVALSSVISRRVHVEQGYFRIYPNLYVVLVGQPGSRKTTAMSTSKSLMREVKDIPFSAESMTKEAIVNLMTKLERSMNPEKAKLDGSRGPLVYSPLTICVTELAEFIGPSQEGMTSFLTTVYDQDFYDYGSIKRGQELITGPYLVLLGCTTPAWITARLRDDIISGGFSRRAIFALETERTKRVAFPEVTAEMLVSWEAAVNYARKLKTVQGVFKWTPDARAFYTDWYDNMVIPDDPMLAGYYDTKHAQLLKVGMLLSLSESTELVLKREHLVDALARLDFTERNLHRVFEGIGRNELNAMAQKTLDILRHHGGKMTEKALFSRMFQDGTEFEIRQVLDHLANSDRIVRGPIQKGTLSVSGIYLYEHWKSTFGTRSDTTQ